MNAILSWFATSPLSTAARVGIGAALTFIVDNIAGFNLDPIAQVAVIALVSTALRALNPLDGAYGATATDAD